MALPAVFQRFLALLHPPGCDWWSMDSLLGTECGLSLSLELNVFLDRTDWASTNYVITTGPLGSQAAIQPSNQTGVGIRRISSNFWQDFGAVGVNVSGPSCGFGWATGNGQLPERDSRCRRSASGGSVGNAYPTVPSGEHSETVRPR